MNGTRKRIDLDALARARREARSGRDGDSPAPGTPRFRWAFPAPVLARLMPRIDLLADARTRLAAAVTRPAREAARRLTDGQAMTRKEFRARFTEMSRKKQRCKVCDRHVSSVIRCRVNRTGRVALVVHLAARNRYYLARRRMESPEVTCPEHGAVGFPDRRVWRYLSDTEYLEPLEWH